MRWQERLMVLLSLDTPTMDCYSLPSIRYSAEIVDTTGLCSHCNDVNVSHLMLLVTSDHVSQEIIGR